MNTFPTYYAWRNWIVFFAKYAKEEDLGRMAECFLSALFEHVYEGMHTGNQNRMKTVMLAYDDAIHGVMGKAGENRIFDLDFNVVPYQKLLEGKKKIYIEENGYLATAGRIQEMASRFGYDIIWTEKKEEDSVTISICESIFKIEDLSREREIGRAHV